MVLACAAHPPELISVSHRLVAYQSEAPDDFLERLNVFTIVRDKDGKDDIDTLYIIHDEQELYWKLTAENWVYKEDVGELWLGKNGLTGPEKRLPRGQYRLLLIDQAGQRAERLFDLSAPSPNVYIFPTFSFGANNSLILDSPYEMNTIFFIDAGGNVVKTVDLKSGSQTLDQLWGDGTWRSRAYYFALYSLDIKAGTGLFTWKTRLPR